MKCMHISFNSYPNISVEHSTKYIWKELMKEFEEYHIFCRGENNKFYTEQEQKLYFHKFLKGLEIKYSF